MFMGLGSGYSVCGLGLHCYMGLSVRVTMFWDLGFSVTVFYLI